MRTILVVLTLLATNASAEEKPWLTMTVSAGGFRQYRRTLNVYAGGRTDDGWRLRPETAARARAMLETLRRRGLLHDGDGHGYDVASGGCTSMASGVAFIWRDGASVYSASSLFSVMTLIKRGRGRGREPEAAILRGLERLLERERAERRRGAIY